MSCREYEAQIGDYVDGALDDAQLAAVESHLSTCASCRAIAEDFAVIRRASLSLEPQLPPPHAWREISSAIEAESRPMLFGTGWWRGLVAAAATLALVASLTFTAARLSPIADERRLASAPTALSPESPASVAFEYARAEQNLTQTIEGLERIASDRSELDMETRDVVQANLIVLDSAIGESREALEKEPENDVAQESLFEALRSKLALLQDTIALINEMRKGNQEGAARIVAGLNP